ncbi:ribosomal protein S16 domain-containing protein [Mycena floridula]|nr:ribosomal protein S16 domain-containing protein [Mycena floridula]
MVVRIRFAMHGVRNNRILHLVAINQTQKRNGKPLELLGVYNPRMTPQQEHKTVQWSVDRIRYWLSVGAIPSKSAVKLLEMARSLSQLSRKSINKTSRATFYYLARRTTLRN